MSLHNTSAQEGSRFKTDRVTLRHERKVMADTKKTMYVSEDFLPAFVANYTF